ncbi:MAG: NAD(P)-dependent oxidoreductase [Burkholderiaceae bacterium]
MTTLVIGGAGFIGLNVVERLLRHGQNVRVLDRAEIPAAARRVFADLPGALQIVRGDVAQADVVRAAIDGDVRRIVLGAAITAGQRREALDPASILAVNLDALIPVLQAARDARVPRIVNLSSVAAFGRRMHAGAPLTESTPCEPVSLYGITKLASEQIGRRLAGLWGFEFINLRLSAAFGPWEQANGVRDTLSAQRQMLSLLENGTPATLSRPGLRDWVYSRDVAEAVFRVLTCAGPLPHDLYLVSSGQCWTALAWGQALARYHDGWQCRLADDGETASVDLHADSDRDVLDTSRFAKDLGWRASYGLEESVRDLHAWLLAATTGTSS